MSNIAGSSVYSNANASTSTLRPRNNRLISYLDEAASDNDVSAQATSTSSSRGASPSNAQSRTRHVVQSGDRAARQVTNRTTNEVSGRRSSSLWDSWSSIQGVASSLLSGGEASTSVGRKGSLKTPAWMKQDTKFSATTSTPVWGPQGKGSTIEPGAIEDRKAIVQAKKREALLLSCAGENKDESGHFKRKTSYDADSRNAPSEPDLGQDALVYKHIVQPRDTMAGVTIKYSCQQEAFRKVNRFWPNDNIQIRTYVLLPVEACSVRGRKVDDATSLELLTTQLNKIELDSKQRSASLRGRRALPEGSPTEIASPRQMTKDEEEYKHDSFVVLPSSDEPVEILRIPRKMLGYFPRARRKSLSLQSDSMSSTPKTSFDMLRHPPTHAAQQAAAALHSLSQTPPQPLSVNSSPVHRPRLGPSSRQRSSSTTTTINSNSDNAWILRGPGGVGTLRGLRTEISRPGPSDDPLNQKFVQYFPGLALSSESEDVRSSNSLHPQPRSKNVSRSPYRSTPRASTDSVRSTRSNSSTFGAGVAGVESFMRKLANSGKRPDMMPRTNSGNLVNAMGLPVSEDAGLGDLIELETNPDALHHDPYSERNKPVGRGAQDDVEDNDATPTEIGKNHEELLNARFPIRGRITRAYAGDD